MSGSANAARGEVAIMVAGEVHVLRPTFAALVAAEAELGPLLALVDRASEGRITLAEIAGLFWHCLARPHGATREAVGEAVLAMGLARATPPLRTILHPILAGAP